MRKETFFTFQKNLTLIIIIIFAASAGAAGYLLMNGYSIIQAMIIPSVIGIVLMGAAVGLLFRKTVNQPIEHLQRAVHLIAEGDLTQRVNMRSSLPALNQLSDEFDTVLVSGLQVILMGMKELIEDNKTIVHEFSSRSRQSLTTTDAITGTIGSIRDQVENLNRQIMDSSSAAEEIAGTINSLGNQVENQAGAVEQTSAAIEEMTASVESVASIAHEKQEATHTLVEITQEGGNKVEFTNRIIEEISNGINDMFKMISVINNVAAQTNLLAMNAAIEAAHAGQYGKGFAVVAEEIRKLAESTAKNTKQITTSLKGFVDQIKQAHQAGDETGAAFKKIQAEVSSFVDAFQEISSNTREVAEGSKEMLEAVSSLRNISEEIKAGTEEMRTGVGDINKGLLSVREFSETTLTHMNDANNNIKEINEVQKEIAALGDKSSETMAQLTTELRYFTFEHTDNKGPASGQAYLSVLRSIILDHKKRVTGAKFLLDGKVALDHIPKENSGAECPLGALIQRMKTETRGLEDETLLGLEKEHNTFHEAYNKFLRAASIDDLETARIEYKETDRLWRELIKYREKINEIMLSIEDKQS